jgi:hypothetical protein
MTPKGEKIR